MVVPLKEIEMEPNAERSFMTGSRTGAPGDVSLCSWPRWINTKVVPEFVSQ